MHADRTKRSFFPSEPLRLLPIVFMSLFAVMVAADAMIAIQPTVLRPLRDSFQHWVGAGWIAPSWASVFATGVAVLAITVAASLLSVFVRGVQTAPYTWLAPIVVGSGAALMGRLPVELPIPFSAPAFALISACAVLGGGALLRRDAFATRFTAVLVMATPLILIAIGYSNGGSSHTPHAVGEFIFLLAMTTFTTAVLGYVTRERSLGEADGSGEQLMDLLERARTAEARAAFAEQQLASAGYGSFAVPSPILSDDDALARMRGGGSSHVVLYAAILFLTGSLAMGYFAGYMPLQNRLDAQRKQAQANDEQHTHALTALRSRFDSERSELQAQLRAAQAGQANAAAAAAPAVAAEPAAPPAAEAPPAKPAVKEAPSEAKPVEAKPVEAKPVEAKKAEPAPAPAVESHARVKLSAAAPASRASAKAAKASRAAHAKKTAARVPAKAAAAKTGAKAAPADAKTHYDDESLDDDPIGGL
jgi:hypothetical protein